MQRNVCLAAISVLVILSGCNNGGDLFGDRFSQGKPVESVDNPQSGVYFETLVGNTVYFNVDSGTLSEETRGSLDKQVDWLLRNPQSNILIAGHADERGTRIYNIALGARRASSVRDFLVSRGLPDSRLETVSYGKERPIAVCSEERCYSQNRRAVTRLTE